MSPPSSHQQFEIPARTGKAIPLPENHTIRIINTHGTQVVDFWALILDHQPITTTSSTPGNQSPQPTPKLLTHLSLPHTRAQTLHLSPSLSSPILYSSLRTPILKLTADTSPGIHDTLIAACDAQRYRMLGISDEEGHASCAGNLREALRRDVGVVWPGMEGEGMVGNWTPGPLNLFMNIPVVEEEGEEGGGRKGKKLSFQPPLSRPGDYVELMALVENVVVVLSCCPQDRVPVNGVGMVPRGVEVVVFNGGVGGGI